MVSAVTAVRVATEMARWAEAGMDIAVLLEVVGVCAHPLARRPTLATHLGVHI